MNKNIYFRILAIPLILFSVFSIFGDFNIPEKDDNIKTVSLIKEEPNTRSDILIKPNLDSGTPNIPEKEIKEFIIEESVEQAIEEVNKYKPKELPDIITVEVKIYDEHGENYNTADGKEYLNDIKKYLEKYAPDGMYLSAASAMAYTEGGSGKKGIYRSTNNCFGIRAVPSWEGYVYSRSTGKVYKDYETSQKYGAKDLFKAYDNMEESVRDYVDLISGDYYNKALTKNSPKEYLKYILDKGYGESTLLNMWLGVINIYDLQQFDK